MKKIFLYIFLITNYLNYDFAFNINSNKPDTAINSINTILNEEEFQSQSEDSIPDSDMVDTDYDYFEEIDGTIDLKDYKENLSTNMKHSILESLTSEEFLAQEKIKIQNLKLNTEKYEKITENINKIIKNQTEILLGDVNPRKLKILIKAEGRDGEDAIKEENNLKKNITLELNITSNRNNTLKTNLISMTNKTSKLKYSTSNTSAESLMASIEYQTQFIKKEICLHSCEISEALDVLIAATANIELSIKDLHNNSQKTLEVIISSINKINIIKADITRLNEIISTIQKVNCPSLAQSGKKIELVLHSVNKLIELITETIKNLKMNLNLVILT